METVASLTFAVVGAVELVKRLFERDFRAVSIIVVASGVGAILAPQVDMTWFAGLLIGLSASGVVTTVTRFNTNG